LSSKKDTLAELKKTLKEIEGLSPIPRIHMEATLCRIYWYQVWDLIKEMESWH